MASLERRGGVYRLRWWEGKQRRSETLGDVSYKEAQQARRDKEDELARGTRTRDTTFAELADDWLAYSKERVRASTYEQYEISVAHLKAHLSGKVRHVRRDDVEAFVRTFSDGRKPKTVNNNLRVLKQILTYGESDAARYVAGVREEPPEIDTFDAQETRRLLAAAEGEEVALVGLAVFGSLRLGEVLGLTDADVDRETGDVRVRRQRKGPPKTKKSYRIVTVPRYVTRALPSRKGRLLPFDPHGARARLRTACDRAGLRHVTFHSLRHTFVSLGSEAGLPIELVSKLAGHSSIQITADKYGHLFAPQRRKAAKQLEKHILGSVLGSSSVEKRGNGGASGGRRRRSKVQGQVRKSPD